MRRKAQGTAMFSPCPHNLPSSTPRTSSTPRIGCWQRLCCKYGNPTQCAVMTHLLRLQRRAQRARHHRLGARHQPHHLRVNLIQVPGPGGYCSPGLSRMPCDSSNEGSLPSPPPLPPSFFSYPPPLPPPPSSTPPPPSPRHPPPPLPPHVLLPLLLLPVLLSKNTLVDDDVEVIFACPTSSARHRLVSSGVNPTRRMASGPKRPSATPPGAVSDSASISTNSARITVAWRGLWCWSAPGWLTLAGAAARRRAGAATGAAAV